MKLVFDIKKAQADAVFDDGTDLVKTDTVIGKRGGDDRHQKMYLKSIAAVAKKHGKK